MTLVQRAATLSPDWSGPLRRLAGRFLDWEDWLTLGLGLGTMLGVTLSLENSGWSSEMPALGLVGVLALLWALLLARSPLRLLLAWPLGVMVGAGVVFWQTLEMVGPGDLEQRLDAVHVRFQAWFQLAFSGGITSDPLPRDVLSIGVTWLTVFLFGWSIYRWHNAWVGLVPGGVALFMNLLLIDDTVPASAFLFLLFGFLLLMRTALASQMRRWRAGGVPYPPLISLSFLHFTLWTGLLLMALAWLAPVGPFPTPGPVGAIAQRFEGVGVDLVRLAGPLRVEKVPAALDYTAVLPFQGSIELDDRELLSVTVDDPFIEGPIVLRGAVFDEYAAGGWKAGPRREVDAPSILGDLGSLSGAGTGRRIVPITVTVESGSLVGTVLFTSGQPLAADMPTRIKVTPGSLHQRELSVPGGGAGLSDEEVLREWLPEGLLGVAVARDDDNRVVAAMVVGGSGLPDVLALLPREAVAEGESYRTLGVVQDVAPDQLRRASAIYPSWLREQRYLQLPRALPLRVSKLASDVAASGLTPYDRAKAIEGYLRGLPVDYRVEDAPPGVDAVDYFLFEARRGYFTHHASAMVVMLRSLDIPSRLAVGFVVDRQEFEQGSGAYVVRARDAYAWVEVYFPGRGWVEFNPTPDRPADLRPRERSDGFLLPSSLEELSDVPGAGGELPVAGAGQTGGSSPGASGLRYFGLAAAAATAWAAAVAAAAALGWRRSVAGLPYPQQLWEKTVRLASWAGQPLRPGETPSEFAFRLQEAVPAASDVVALCGVYSRSRFASGKASSEDENERLRRLWPRLRTSLLTSIYSRLWDRWR